MALNMGRRMLLVLLVSLCFLHYASSQQVAPSNDTIPNDDHTYVLQTTEGSMVTSTRIEPLAPDAKLNTQQSITGQLVLATAQTVSSVAQGNIAYISCDPSAYPGNIDATHTINIAVSQNPRAIILFSNTSAACTFKPTNIFTFSVIYTMVEANRSSQLQDEIEAASPHPAPVQIQMGSLGGNATTTTQSQGIGHSPTTAVAMIILYSITGIITALFLIIIIVGAIRAHRHPERYGPQNMLGRPRQSRARGIARAMLDTLPIVKFGEREEEKIVQPAPHGSNPQARDIELGNPLGEARPDQHQATIPPRTSAEQTTVARDGPTHDGSEPVTTETVAGTDQLPAGEAQTDSHADNGLACSVCTDDFVKGQDIRVLPCNHKFHPECIDPWLLNVSGTCPMCRVDLRPIASHSDPAGDFDSSYSAESVTYAREEGPPQEPPADGATPAPQRRSRTGLSLYIQHTLNRGRMRDATPEERLAALRRLRTVNRASDPEPGSARNRISARLSRAFDSERRHSSQRGSYAG